MSADEAIQILDQVTAQVPLVRADQAKVLQAIAVLREAVRPKPEQAIITPTLAGSSPVPIHEITPKQE